MINFLQVVIHVRIWKRDGLKSMRQDFVFQNDWFYKKDSLSPKNREKSNKNLMSCYDSNTHSVSREGLRHVEFRFSTACNFCCLHCSKVYSSGWTKKLKNYVPDQEVINNDLRQLMGTEHRHGLK